MFIIVIAVQFILNTKISPTHHVKHTNYEGNPQFIIKIVYSFVVDIKIITPKYFRLLFFRHHQGRMIVKNSVKGGKGYP